MGRQEDFGMDNAALAGVVMGQPVPLVCDFLTASVSCCGNGRLAFPPADNLNAAMVNCDSTTSRFWLFRLVESEQLAKQGVRFLQVHKGVDSASCRRGSVASPVCGKAAISERGAVSCEEISPRQSAHARKGV